MFYNDDDIYSYKEMWNDWCIVNEILIIFSGIIVIRKYVFCVLKKVNICIMICNKVVV